MCHNYSGVARNALINAAVSSGNSIVGLCPLSGRISTRAPARRIPLRRAGAVEVVASAEDHEGGLARHAHLGVERTPGHPVAPIDQHDAEHRRVEGAEVGHRLRCEFLAVRVASRCGPRQHAADRLQDPVHVALIAGTVMITRPRGSVASV